jgi:hypothetical protein
MNCGTEAKREMRQFSPVDVSKARFEVATSCFELCFVEHCTSAAAENFKTARSFQRDVNL